MLMNAKPTKTQKNRLTVSSESVLFLPRHCEERLGGKKTINEMSTVLTINERRGNLPSLMNWRGFFNSYKTTLPRSQSSSRFKILVVVCRAVLADFEPRKIATRMQQHQLSFFTQFIRRLAMTSVAK
jgi:hypothetical protein